MRAIVRILVVVWALISGGLGILAFAVVNGTGGSLATAAREAFETIPEAVMQALGFEGAPLALVIAYWTTLAAAVFLAFTQPKQS